MYKSDKGRVEIREMFYIDRLSSKHPQNNHIFFSATSLEILCNWKFRNFRLHAALKSVNNTEVS